MEIEFKVEDTDVMAALGRLMKAAQDMTPAMRDIAGILAFASEQAFEHQVDPTTGDPWPDLSDLTKQRRAENGHWPGQILQVTGALARDIQTDYGADFAVAGTNKVYAPTQYRGASKGQYGRTKTGGPIPWGDIPARPFLGAGDEDKDEILDVLRRHFEAAVNGV